MRFEGLLSLYLDSLREERRLDTQLKAARQGLVRLFDHLEKTGIRDVRRVREADVVSFVRGLSRARSERTGRRLAVNTCSLYVSVVRRFFAFLEERRLVFQSPGPKRAAPRAHATSAGDRRSGRRSAAPGPERFDASRTA